MQVEFVFWPTLPSAEADWEPLGQLLADVLGSPMPELLRDLRYQQARQPVQVWLALAAGQLVGCKLGYERQPGHYYSWLGGVVAGFRNQGIAGELLRRQHAWCQEQGYQRLRTHTYNHWRAMLLLNLRHGFNIIGTQHGPRGLTIVLEKVLGEDD